jgi:hypothetical protein
VVRSSFSSTLEAMMVVDRVEFVQSVICVMSGDCTLLE